MRILVTGGAGFIGGHIVDAALARGWEVRILDSLNPAVHPDRPLPNPGAPLLVGDVGDASTVAVALEGIDVVVHQSAKVGLGVDFSDAPEYIRNNDLATAVLLAGMAAAGTDKLVLASSMVVYGEGAYTDSAGRPVRPGPRRVEDLERGIFDPRDPVTGELLLPVLVTEDAALDPGNVYAASKLAQENLASAWARSTGGAAAALRYHNVYGPWMPKDTPYAGVASLFRSALARGEAPRVFEDGGQRRSFIHVADVAEANLCAVEALAAGGVVAPGSMRAYNVGASEVHTIGAMAGVLSAVGGGPVPVITGDFRLGDVRHITASSARAKAELGWAPRHGFEDGMREFATAPLRGDRT
ncbi:NAD-dependent epimerase/dehydratase family protein [Pseudarthrobacter psychrotolerans]|uniref:NAD-dependent epimerase/dehydratase family protein n=1 Tax=Pseudarthrobacter psychrotolerans TaxID=2697569 RepID=A0A6P1NJJ8_9MICC|nr:NAD-dependent epimerase/dehydratase family protein [Pseudarthrobacter psychrotolerans]QHK18630.1 NAD-dependent epimerase/dehydratase family protein [Pseudarthrobacter psychrotolerans]